jgi:DNA-binding SARP family transcriptional activator
VPGASNTVSEGLAVSLENVDELAAVRKLLAELPRLLVEPLILVVDDAEQLDGAERSLALLSELIRAELPMLHMAVASRRPLGLRVAKARASGKLTELTGIDLAFADEECAALIGSLQGSDPAPDRVSEMMEATEGWPLGIGLAAAQEQRDGPRPRGVADLRSTLDLHAFFAEEFLESLTPELREAAIESSVARRVSPEVAAALDLPKDFGERVEQAGMLVRRAGDGFAYHPLLRDFLLERLADERGEEERRRLHGAVAPAIAAGGDQIEAIEHWIAAELWDEATAAIEREGPVLVRTSSGLMRRWLSLLPPASRELPTMLSLEGQLAWGEGDHTSAAAILRDAVRGFEQRPDPPAEWLARFVLADSLFSIGEFGELSDLVAGWEHTDAPVAGVLAPATVIFVSVAFATIGRFEESDDLSARALAHPDADLLRPVEALRLAYRDTPPGHLDRVLAGVTAAERELEVFDPFNRRLYFLSTLAFMYAERGHTDEAIGIWKRVREGAQGGGGPFLVDTTYAWCAQLHTQQGRLAEAEAELAHYVGREVGWQTCIGDLARASVAALRGDASEALARGDRALEVVSKGPAVFIHRTVAELVPVFAGVGRSDRARKMLADALALVDEAFPMPRGRFLRGRLVALRAWLAHIDGDVEGSEADLKLFWAEAGKTLPHVLRREWVRLQPVVWSALERGALEPTAIDEIADAFPEGLQLVAFLDHPVPAVRAKALTPATESGDPEALVHLGAMAKDPDPVLADAAAKAIGELGRILPPLRFEVLGRFGAGRGAWDAADAWDRPVDARLVRLLLVNLGQPVPEDLIFAALWPDLSASSARKSLQVAASRARRVIDPPGAESSVLESADRSYRLSLGARDRVDAEQFRDAAAAGLAESGDDRRRLLETARGLWGGEPMPEERYSDWAAAYRERLSDQYTQVLADLVEIHQQAGEHAEATAAARDLIELDPLNEGGHRALITSYARAGRTGRALRQYLECRRALVEELGVEPAETTSRLQARILAGEPV